LSGKEGKRRGGATGEDEREAVVGFELSGSGWERDGHTIKWAVRLNGTARMNPGSIFFLPSFNLNSNINSKLLIYEY